MIRQLKRIGESALAWQPLISSLLRCARGSIVILAYHDVVPTGEPLAGGDASLHLRQEDFARQLEALQESHTVVPLSAILDPLDRTAMPRAAITFDDAYEGALTAGVDELVKRRLSATIFVAPGLLGQETWWDSLGARGILSFATRQFALRELCGDRDRVLSWARQLKAPVRSSPFRIGTESDVLAAARRPGITLGSHTWSHRNLCGLSQVDLELELSRPLAWLRSKVDTYVAAMSYPYGVSSPPVERATAAAGYNTGFRVDGGAVNAGAAPHHFALPRLNVPAGLSIDGFRLRLAGLPLS